jgi:CBS domain-containing protein
MRERDSRLREVMNPSVLTFPDDKSVNELAAFLTTNEISGVAVVDARKHLVGVVSVTDIVEQRVESEPGTLVRDIMTPTVYTIPEDTPVSEVARTMIAGRIHRLFVTREGHVVGIVTTLDLLKLLCQDEPVGAEPTKRHAAR